MSRLSDKRLRSHVLQVFQHHSSHGSRKPVALTWWNSAKQSQVHSQWQKLSGRLLTPGKAISDFSSEHFLQRCKVNAYTHALPTHKNSDSYGTILRLHTSMTFSSFFLLLFFLYCTGVSMTTENEINAFSILNHTFCMAGPHYGKTGKKLIWEIWFTDVGDQNEHGLIWLQYRSTSKLVHIPEIKTPLPPSFRHVCQSL